MPEITSYSSVILRRAFTAYVQSRWVLSSSPNPTREYDKPGAREPGRHWNRNISLPLGVSRITLRTPGSLVNSESVQGAS